MNNNSGSLSGIKCVAWGVMYLIIQSLVCYMLWIKSPRSGGYESILIGVPAVVVMHTPYIENLLVSFGRISMWAIIHHGLFFLGLGLFWRSTTRWVSLLKFMYLIYYGSWVCFGIILVISSL